MFIALSVSRSLEAVSPELHSTPRCQGARVTPKWFQSRFLLISDSWGSLGSRSPTEGMKGGSRSLLFRRFPGSCTGHFPSHSTAQNLIPRPPQVIHNRLGNVGFSPGSPRASWVTKCPALPRTKGFHNTQDFSAEQLVTTVHYRGREQEWISAISAIIHGAPLLQRTGN